MKAILSSMIVLSAACTQECPKLQPPDPCKDPVVAMVADAAPTATSSPQRDTLEFVRLGYGDSHDLHVRSLEFRTECLSTSLMQQALRLVPEYNAFEGPKIADGIEKLRGEIMCWQFGREGSPVIYMQLPYWLSQAEKACPARHDSIRRSGWMSSTSATACLQRSARLVAVRLISMPPPTRARVKSSS